MCGLVGFLSQSSDASEQICLKMANKLAHRGPDDYGVWMDQNGKVALGHRRLAIQDISPLGHQPMMSSNSRYVLIFNGEIYNFSELSNDLKSTGSKIFGGSDTEVLLEAIVNWGIQKTLDRIRGMFSFVLWDINYKKLTLARDRIGEKPLYYGWQGKSFLFASELKALKVHPSFEGEICEEALSLFMNYNNIPAPYSIYKNVKKLMPGSLITLDTQSGKTLESTYWDTTQIAMKGLTAPFEGSFEQSVNRLETLLENVISAQAVADVPLGAFLSGGVDSSTVVALMQKQSMSAVRTFSIGFEEVEYNEAREASKIAKHLKTDHTELYVSSSQALEVIAKLPSLFCEPFADSSAIPTFLVSELARQKVTVALSGDGGDELFGGYNRYLVANQLWGTLSKVPYSVRILFKAIILSISPAMWSSIIQPLQSFIPSKFSLANYGDKIHKGAEVMTAQCPEELYRLLVAHWKEPSSIVKGLDAPLSAEFKSEKAYNKGNFIEKMMLSDLLNFLPNDILTKVDRAAMGTSLETRIPLLDHRVVEFAWSLPLQYKISNGVGKLPLRNILYKYVPKNLIERPKMGFGIPLNSWLRGPLREWAEELLDENRLEREGYLFSQPIRKKWEEHLSGRRNWQYQLWNVLMFQAWLEEER